MTALATMAALLTVFAGLLLVAGVMVARGTAQTAADLAALAAARSLLDGGPSPCGRAGAVAGANGAALVSCVAAGEEVTVTARAPVVWGGRATGLHAAANARAGPEPPGN
nr:pilus assembly protein TadE [Actinomycetales bacterium]